MGNLLTGLFVCGLMGLIGQGTRAVVGLSDAKASGGTGANQQSTFNAAYLTVSLIVGFIAGILAGLALGVPTGDGSAPNRQTLLGLIAAGYAGTDFIENTFARLLPSIGALAPGADVPTVGERMQAATDNAVHSLTDTVQKLSASVSTMASQTAAKVATTPGTFDLANAVAKILPNLDATTWVPLLNEAFKKYSIDTPLRVAAAMGQFVAEADEAFRELRENMTYSAAGLMENFPNEIKNQATADSIAGNAEEIANLVYANRNGNGGVNSGDGFMFRGGGLCQLTGRTEYTQFATAMGIDLDHTVAYVASAEGAAISGCWYLSTKGCLPLADKWQLTEITKIVNGGGMKALTTRIDYANKFRIAFGAALPTA